MFFRIHAFAGGFHAMHRNACIIQEGVEQPHGIGTAANRCHQQIRQAPFGGHHLLARFCANDGLEIAHHHREGMRAGDRADAVIGIMHIGDPIAQPFIHRILQRRSTGGHGHNLCPQ